ncbi:hypothetical protein OG453_40240 [Streptomyces sp. NBC_01381]|uniref:M20/M25/M40 family metallo-hydrolase n=1 Tax=Streptomyces sp. NBC_01381 TaxID=2903845 RepID=UPI002255244F|nr:M20/M25/M40 family metallo-hydrolase [Streptomyces sp. NBC_01381]MCX4672801.1 hypothetical protein [Streptomyces sp. NBC_01381]
MGTNPTAAAPRVQETAHELDRTQRDRTVDDTQMGQRVRETHLKRLHVAQLTADVVDLAEEAATALYGPGTFVRLPSPLMASEDFARVTAAVPGAQLMVSARPRSAGDDAAFNHSAYAVFDDAALPIGTALLAELAERGLAAQGARTDGALTEV